jgi:16S rRNA (adenine1518-N6/adenine1519-N6)-dimethyltransferase
LRGLFAAHGIRPKSKLGQNFLIDLNLLDLVVRAAEVDSRDLVLEIGTGTGSLTGRLAESAGAVISVEIDRDFHELARQALRGRPNVHLLHLDILKRKNEIAPEVIQSLQKLQHESGFARLKLVANLPYVVATPVIANLLLSELSFERMVVMVQEEIAGRLLAEPGTRDYGALAVLVQSIADVTAVRRRVPPAVFWPRPEVSSAVVSIRPNLAKREQVGDVQRFRNFLRDLYTHRRKNLRGGLSGLPSGRREKAEVDARLNELGIPGTARAEDLDIEQHLRLSNAFG